jgi:hypothetical protein
MTIDLNPLHSTIPSIQEKFETWYPHTKITNIEIGSIQGWGTQKECLSPKSISKQYFEWPLHVRNNLFGRFSFSLDICILLH